MERIVEKGRRELTGRAMLSSGEGREGKKVRERCESYGNVEEMVTVEAKGKGIIVGRVKVGEERWRIVGVYVGRRGIGETLQELDEWIGGEGDSEKTIIGGDFNARTGTEGGGIMGEEEEGREEEGGRMFKDVMVNREGRLLMDFLEEREWMIFNDAIRGNEEGNLYLREGGGIR